VTCLYSPPKATSDAGAHGGAFWRFLTANNVTFLPGPDGPRIPTRELLWHLLFLAPRHYSPALSALATSASSRTPPPALPALHRLHYRPACFALLPCGCYAFTAYHLPSSEGTAGRTFRWVWFRQWVPFVFAGRPYSCACVRCDPYRQAGCHVLLAHAAFRLLSWRTLPLRRRICIEFYSFFCLC